MLKGQMSIFEDKLIKKTNKYEVARHGSVYRIHFYDKEIEIVNQGGI